MKLIQKFHEQNNRKQEVKIIKMNTNMLSDKELKYLEELENNKDVIYLLNTRECELISKMIKSYKEIRRQITALQLSKD